MTIQETCLNYRSIIHKDGKFAIIRFENDSPLDHRFGIPDDRIFRYWDVVDSDKSRYLCVDDNFNLYRDSIYDYPIIASKLLNGINWEKFNKSTLIQIGACTDFVCWHCYLAKQHIKGDQKIFEYVSGKEVVNRYIHEREKFYAKNHNTKHGVDLLRIHGGEPLLAPEIILEILEELKVKNLDSEIFVWSETNLSPTYQLNEEKSFIEQINFDLSQLSKFKNFALHPCFHGISQEDFERNTALKNFKFEGFLNSFKNLINSGINVFPTFGSNVNKKVNIEAFFNQIKEINNQAPRKFALIEYKAYYDTVKERLMCWQELNKEVPDKVEFLYSLLQTSNEKNDVLTKWNNLILKEYNEPYLKTNRVNIEL